MITIVDGQPTHAATGGVELRPDEPTIVLIHGAGMDSTAWYLQTRYLAHRGFRALAVDLPAHGRSAGSPLASVEEIAEWVAGFAKAADAAEVHVVGHSLGTFVGLELARLHPKLVLSLTMCGTSTAMPVHPDLMDAAEHDVPAAAALMSAWSHARPAHVGLNPTPGLWMLGGVQALIEASTPGVLANDLRACAAYAGALTAAAAVACTATVVVGLGDKMTPPKGGRALAAAIPHAHVVELAGTGHMMMVEDPRGVKQAIIDTVRRSTADR